MAALPYSRALTVDDLGALPDDGHRYELIDGSLLVTPAPGKRHQVAALRLAQVLDRVVPPGMTVVIAPYEWRRGRSSALQPDLLVCRSAPDLPYETEPPVVVVEVLSPSTRAFDLSVKRDEYDRGGVEAYWLVDPDVPSVTVLGRQGERLTVVATAEGDEQLRAESPFPVTLRPSDLTR